MSCIYRRDSVSVCFLVSLQKFGDQSVEQIERMRYRHRIRVLQGHEDTTKQNVVSRGLLNMVAHDRCLPVVSLLVSNIRMTGVFCMLT